MDAVKHSLTNQVVEQLAVAPETPVQGQVYYDTVDDHVKVYVVV